MTLPFGEGIYADGTFFTYLPYPVSANFYAVIMLPNTIILDTYSQVKEFRILAQQVGEPSEFVDNVIQEIIERLLCRYDGLNHVYSFAAEINAGVHLDDDGFVQIDPMFAPIVLELGKTILEQLRRHHTYGSSGWLPYHFHLPNMPEYPSDIMLTLTHEPSS